MAEIVPDSTITLLFNVPLNNKYDNTYYFSSLNEQANFFFSNFSKQTFGQQSYQRKNRGWLKLSARYRDVFNANYMYFMNNFRSTAPNVGSMTYEQKQFYAFITEVNYINDMTVEIRYEIDVIQSYMFNWSFQDCLVVRETTSSDNIGEHILDEGLPVGDYINNNTGEMYFNGTNANNVPLSTPYYLVASTFEKVGNDYLDASDGHPVNNVASGMPIGCHYELFNTAQGVINYINDVPGEKLPGIISVNVIPFLAAISIALNPNNTTWTHSFQKGLYQSTTHTLDGYTPRNNKLQCYPYNFCLIQGADGNSQEFAYEQFDSINITFYLDICCSLPVQGMLYPKGYKKSSSLNNELEIPYALYTPPTASCTFSTDTFKAWYALNSGFIQTQVVSSISDLIIDNASALLGAAKSATHSTGDMYLSELSSAKQIKADYDKIADTYYTVRNAKRAPDAYNGTAQNQLLMVSGHYGFWHVNRCVKYEYAKALDNFFTLFGYKVNRLGKPSIHNRTRFTYVKTIGMDIDGFIPSDDRDEINKIFDNGIRFWVDKTNYCDYTQDNALLT